MPRYGYYWAPSPAAIREAEMKALGYGGRVKYTSVSDLNSSMLKGPWPIPRRGTETQYNIESIDAVLSHDLKANGLKFRVRAKNKSAGRLVEIDIEHFVLLKFESGMCQLKNYITKKLDDKQREEFKRKLRPLFEKAMKSKDVPEAPEPEPGSVLQQFRGAPKPPKEPRVPKKTKKVDENDPWRNKSAQYAPYVKRPDDDEEEEVEEEDDGSVTESY